ncbi:MAG: type II toxin-antitoxin system VapC family toxin [Planctomycetes bacterium]|nr:type II toxin-antitoxin system VapC family toxin [Planctomycetota bacterium]
MSRFCLDTSAYSQFKRGHREVAELLNGASYVAVSSIVIGELWLGFLGGTRVRENELELRQFLEHRVVEEVPVDHDIARIYAEIVRALQSKGTPLPTNDIWIAAVAARVGATVLTFDQHFGAIQRVGSLVLGE